MLKVTPTKSAAELSEEEQMAQYEEALKETGAINPVSQALGQTANLGGRVVKRRGRGGYSK